MCVDTKYYYPDSEEVHVGLICETYSITGLKPNHSNEHDPFIREWIPIIVEKKHWDYTARSAYWFDPHPFSKEPWLRIKYLDREDIESLGWVLNENSGYYKKIACRSEIWSFEDPHEYKIKVCFNWENIPGALVVIYGNLHNVGFNNTIFEGIIKNKTELIKILNQLRIDMSQKLTNLPLIRELRILTQSGLSDCKKALDDIETLPEYKEDLPDKDKIKMAKDLLHQQKKIIKSTNSVLTEGLVIADVSLDGKVGVILSLGCVTDFAAKNDSFTRLADSILALSIANKAESALDVLQLDFDEELTISDAIYSTSKVLGEHIELLDYRLVNLDPQVYKGYSIYTYSHHNNKLSSLAVFKTVPEKHKQSVRDILMHIAAFNPLCYTRIELVDDIIENEKQLYTSNDIHLTDEVKQKIVEGKLNKFYKEACLEENTLSQHKDITVKEFLKNNDLVMLSFDRMTL